MSDGLFSVLLITLVIIGIALAIYIFKQIKFLKDANEKVKAQEEDGLRKQQEHRDYLIDSIKIISHAVEHDEKMTLTEGCIRLSALVESLSPSLLQQPELIVLLQVQQKTQHIPFLEKWRSLDRKEQRKYQREMMRIEAEHGEKIISAVKYLNNYPFKQLIH